MKKDKPNFMKKINLILIISAIVFSSIAFGQTDKAICKIAAVARYSSSGVELRWIPDNKTVLRLGFNSSFTVERSDSGSSDFLTIASVKSYPMDKWDSLIAREKNPETLANLQLAEDFLFGEKNTSQNKISFENGIAELNEQKSKEDMVYAVFVMTVIKDTKVAQALGLGLNDNSVKEGRTYTYRIKLNAASPVYEIEDGIVNIKAAAEKDKYKNEVFVYPGDGQLSFAWSAKPELSGYFVERAGEEDTVFKPLNTVPFYATAGSGYNGPTNGSYVDASLTNYKTYKYRFYGISAFGEKILFAEVKGMPRDLTPPNDPIIKKPKEINAKQVLIAWDIYGDLSDLKGFIVAHSDKDSGDYKILNKTLLPASIRSYIDTSFNKEGINYYVVYALDTAGNISSSYPAYAAMVDSTPPAKPQISNAIIDSLGIVTLTVKLNSEKDLKGYRIYKANSPDHEFSVIQEAFKKDKDDTSRVKTVFIDTVTLNSLTPKIYYRVKALDYNYNESEFSDIAEVVRPDTIPPVTPVFTHVVVTEKQVELYFVPSSSEDVKQHIIYRKTDTKSNWEMLKVFDSLLTAFIDTGVTTGVTYYYTIRAKDKSGLFSGYAAPVYGKPYDTGIRPPVENLIIKVEQNKIILTWDYPAQKLEPRFVIYKKDSKGRLKQYDSTAEKTFTDKNPGKENYYAIKVFTKDGGQSLLSKVVSKIIE